MSATDFPSSLRPVSQSPTVDVQAESEPNPPRRRKVRHKPQLSYHACRRRKVRCDRLRPCSNCSSRGHASSCAYPTEPPRISEQAHVTSDVQDRIAKLERLVMGLMQQVSPMIRSSSEQGPEQIPAGEHRDSPREHQHPKLNRVHGGISSSETGSLRLQESGLKYVSPAHWTAVLDDIAGLEGDSEPQDNSAHRQPGLGDIGQHTISCVSGPLLLYGGGSKVNLTRSSILDSIPPRQVVDRLVSRYFNTVATASGVPHTGKFQREYNEFWEIPQKAPIAWIGLLFAMMCLSSQLQQSSATPTSECQQSINLFRERTVQCLFLGNYTNGGPHVLETLLLYLMTEFTSSKDAQSGIRLLIGIIIQIAMDMGYHRDSSHFPNVSAFEGEMRRRIWALIFQIDFGTSTQMGLPRLLTRASHTDVAEPRNLADSDFDEDTVQLPQPRPDTELTPALYSAAKLSVFSVGVKVADLTSETRCPSYDHVLHLDQQLNAASKCLPSYLKWTGLASCLTESSQVILQRIFLQVCIHRIKITLHKRFQLQHNRSKDACLTSAMEILKLQHLIDEENQPDGRLYQSRWSVTSAFTHDFLLATSVLCFYLKMFSPERHREGPGFGDAQGYRAPVSVDEIQGLLRVTRAIWLRESSAGSKEAKRASEALQHVLDDHPPRLQAAQPSPDYLDAQNRPGFPNPFPDLGSDGLTWQMFGQGLNSGVDMWPGLGAW